MAAMLTATQVQDLLDVDATTVYRMARDGRLPAVRVGRQWRFPADAIEDLLVPAGAAAATGAASANLPVLPPELATEVLELVAPLIGTTMVVTDLGGRAVTPIVRPAPAIAARLEEPGFLDECRTQWRGFAAETHLAPRLQPSAGGFLCAHAFVRRGARLVAMVLAGGIAAGDEPDLFHLDDDQRREVIETLPRTAALLSRLVVDPTATGTDHEE